MKSQESHYKSTELQLSKFYHIFAIVAIRSDGDVEKKLFLVGLRSVLTLDFIISKEALNEEAERAGVSFWEHE